MTTKNLYAIVLALLLSQAIVAQDEGDDFEFGSDSGSAFDTGFDDGPPEPAIPLAGDPTSSDDDSSPLVDADPAVNEVLLSDPKSASDLVRAVDVLASLDRYELAQQYLEKLIALGLDKPALGSLHRKVGSGVLIRISRINELNPQAKEFTATVFRAATFCRWRVVVQAFLHRVPPRPGGCCISRDSAGSSGQGLLG